MPRWRRPCPSAPGRSSSRRRVLRRAPSSRCCRRHDPRPRWSSRRRSPRAGSSAQWAMNASRSLASKFAIRFASGSIWCSNSVGRSSSRTSRRCTRTGIGAEATRSRVPMAFRSHLDGGHWRRAVERPIIGAWNETWVTLGVVCMGLGGVVAGLVGVVLPEGRRLGALFGLIAGRRRRGGGHRPRCPAERAQGADGAHVLRRVASRAPHRERSVVGGLEAGLGRATDAGGAPARRRRAGARSRSPRAPERGRARRRRRRAARAPARPRRP